MKDDSRWTMATAEDGGKPLIFRIRNETPAFANKEGYPHLMAVSWQYTSPNDSGMPSPDETQRMSDLEDLLDSGLEGSREAFLTVAVTGNGVREWQWYARNPEHVMAQVNKTLGHLDPFPIEISFQDDPEWAGYEGFLAILAPGQ
jgi:hypothetical protein